MRPRARRLIAAAGASNVLVADASAVVAVAAKTGTFYGKKMAKGRLTVIYAGNVLVGEDNYFRVQMLAVKTGAYYGVHARAGRVYAIAGNGKPPLF